MFENILLHMKSHYRKKIFCLGVFIDLFYAHLWRNMTETNTIDFSSNEFIDETQNILNWYDNL